MLHYARPPLPPLWYSKASRWIRDRAWLWLVIVYILVFFVWPLAYDEPMDAGADIMIEEGQ
jgi:hypothetical protein